MNNTEYKIEEPKRSRRKIISLIVLLALVLALVGVGYYYTKINQGSSDDSVPTTFTVNKGASTRQIANQLAEQKIIRNPNVFVVYSMLNGAADKIQAGEYTLDRKMSIVEIIDILTVGKVIRDEKRVTWIEGWSNIQIKNYLVSRNITTAEEFDATVLQSHEFKFTSVAKQFEYEGFLFPDTYVISKNDKLPELIQKALSNFEEKFTDKMLADMQTKNLSMADVITLASIIEKEVGRNTDKALTQEDLDTMQKERELVASVFYNRLEIGMMLQSDATVNYATGRSDRSARAEDLQVDSRYNTYKYAGLPPGPIGSPGIGSIKAAIYPTESDYLYFLHDPEGIPYFGKTLEEHNVNREKYLR